MTTELAPTGPVLAEEEEILRRSVTAAMMKDGVPMWGAFKESTHDMMSSTHRGNVAPEAIVAGWTGSELAGVWPVNVGDVSAAGMMCYDDGGKPCACGSCVSVYPENHASIDFRVWDTRGLRERAARNLRDAAVARRPLLQLAGWTPESADVTS